MNDDDPYDYPTGSEEFNRVTEETSFGETDDSGIRYPNVNVRLSGQDGNAGSIMGAVTTALRRHGVSSEEINQFRVECMSGSYDQLLQTAMSWVSVS